MGISDHHSPLFMRMPQIEIGNKASHLTLTKLDREFAKGSLSIFFNEW